MTSPPNDGQAVLSLYETFTLESGHVVKLPPGDGGDGQKWNRAPGNLFCAPVEVRRSRCLRARARGIPPL
jgi:hypothetical protein